MPQGQQGPKGRLALLALPLLLVGCGSPVRPSITVSPRVSLSTDPVDIRVVGLKAHADVSVQLQSRDYSHVLWVGRRTYRTDGHGRVKIGSGLLGSMRPSSNRVNVEYIWNYSEGFQLRVTQGTTHLSTTFERKLGAPTPMQASIAHDGFAGLYYASPKPRKPAILLFGGSEGGLQSGFLAAVLAAQGFPTLAIAYFDYPGLPKVLDKVPLEYFAKALRWLDRRPGIDPKHVFVLGISRGSEAAQLLGVHFPQLVHGVVAVVPSDYVNECFGTVSCSGSGWSLGGKPLPFTGVGFPEGKPAYAEARIPDERIKAPLLLICAKRDLIWLSCPYARDAMRHLHSDRYPHELIVEPAAGHGIGSLVPYESTRTYRTDLADERAREDVWPKLIAFLGKHG